MFILFDPKVKVHTATESVPFTRQIVGRVIYMLLNPTRISIEPIELQYTVVMYYVYCRTRRSSFPWIGKVAILFDTYIHTLQS